MSRLETSIPNPTPGAGRYRDWIWPDPTVYGNTDNASSRIAGLKATVGQLPMGLFALGGGAGSRTNVRHQSPCIDLVCSAVVGNGNARSFNSGRLMFATTTAAMFSSQLVDDARCWRVVIIGGMVNAPTVEHDIGFACIPTVNGADCFQLILKARDGFGFGFQADGSVRFFSNVGGVVTSQTITPTAAGGYAIDAMHAYEIRIAGATPTSDATLGILLDGVGVALPVGLSSWAPATTNLPAITSFDVNSAGFLGGVGCISNGVANAMYVNSARIMCGPTPQSCL